MATTNINEVENMLDNLDPSTVKARDAVHFRRIIAAQDGVARADRELHESSGPDPAAGAESRGGYLRGSAGDPLGVGH